MDYHIISLEIFGAILWVLLPPIINLLTDYINQITRKQPELFGRKMQYVNTKGLSYRQE